LSAGDLDGAISQFRSAVGAMPDYAPAHFELGLALQRKGQREEAEKELRRAGEIDPRLVAP
jgi:Flp pilus assembly protein TadD